MHPIRQMEHLKVVPEYLVPTSMRRMLGYGDNNNGKNRNKNKRKASSNYKQNSMDQRMKKSKLKDPLYADSVEDDNERDQVGAQQTTSGEESDTKNNYNETGNGFNIAGRNEWKIRL